MIRKSILFVAPFNQRSRDTESVMIEFAKEGYNVYFFSLKNGNEICSILKSYGIKCFTSNIDKLPYSLQFFIFFFRVFFLCWRFKVNTIFSHLEPAHFICVFIQFVVRAKVYVCRHHVDELNKLKVDDRLSYKLIYKLGKRFIVVSKRAFDYMVKVEGILPERISIVPLAYNFHLFELPDKGFACTVLRQKTDEVLLLTACRLVEDKRPDLSLYLIRELLDRGIRTKLMICGQGDFRGYLEKLIIELDITENVIFYGYVRNLQDFLFACDYLVHPSLIDSSAVVVKEAGLVERPVVVCKGIGDCDEYIVNGKNGFIVSTNNFVIETANLIQETCNFPNRLAEIGCNLRDTIKGRFCISKVFPIYKKLVDNER